MRAIVITGRGGPEVLALRDVPIPKPGPRQVMIRIAAAGLNRADLLLQAQQAPVADQVNTIPGLEVAGVVEATGSRARRFTKGDRVMALSLGGGYAEFCAVDERLVIAWPDFLTSEQAAGAPEAVATVWTSLIDRGRPRRGEQVLVHGGASTIGTLAIAYAHNLGCRAVATAGSAEKCAATLRAGASGAVSYRDANLTERLLSESDGKGYDVILDMAGGDAIARNVELLAPRGRMVMIGMMAGRTGTLDVLPLMAKRASLLGSTLFFRTPREKQLALAKGWQQLAPLAERPGGFPLHVDRVFPLEQAADAQHRLNAADHSGKIVIRP